LKLSSIYNIGTDELLEDYPELENLHCARNYPHLLKESMK
jgi:hypothetical protein